MGKHLGRKNVLLTGRNLLQSLREGQPPAMTGWETLTDREHTGKMGAPHSNTKTTATNTHRIHCNKKQLGEVKANTGKRLPK